MGGGEEGEANEALVSSRRGHAWGLHTRSDTNPRGSFDSNVPDIEPTTHRKIAAQLLGTPILNSRN